MVRTGAPVAGRRDVDGEAAFRLLVALGQGLHRYGTPVHRLERALEETAAALGLRASFLATPTSLQSTAEIQGDQRLHLARQNAGEVDLGKLAALDELAQRAIQGEIGILEARREVDEIVRQPDRYSAPARVLSFGLSSGGFACFLGATWTDAGAAVAAGLVIGLLSIFLGEGRRGSELFAPLAAFVLAFVVPALAGFVEISVPLVVLAGLIVLVPGLTVTQAVTELAQSSLVSGTSRLFGAAVVFLLLAFGSLAGSAAAAALWGVPASEPASASTLPFPVLLVAVLATSVSFLVMFRAELRDFPALFVCGLLTFLAAWGTAQWLAPERSAAPIAAFLGAVTAGVLSNAHARIFRRPALVTRVPAMMHLVPGSLGFRAVILFGAADTMGGVELVFTVAVIAVAIATGLLFANVLVTPRQRL